MKKERKPWPVRNCAYCEKTFKKGVHIRSDFNLKLKSPFCSVECACFAADEWMEEALKTDGERKEGDEKQEEDLFDVYRDWIECK